MPQQELLKRAIGALRANGIDYMVTGSIVSSLQGDPRSTHDIDIVVAIPPSAADALIEAFSPPDYYLDRQAMLDAIRNSSMFNLLEVTTGGKIDFWLLTDEKFDRERFRRKQVEEVEGLTMNVSRPEDTILMKLRWAELSGGSEKQFRDALRVYEVQYPILDLAYIERWAVELRVEKLWQRLKQCTRSTE